MRRLKKHHGFFLGDFLEEYLDSKFAMKRVSRKTGCTFQKLYEEKNVELRVGVCNIVSREFEYLDRHSHPTLKVAQAVRASSAIPLVFLPQQIGDGVYVDGMFQGNLPIAAFPGQRVLGFHLSGSQPEREKPMTVLGVVTAILDMLLNSAQRKHGVNFDTFVFGAGHAGQSSIALDQESNLLDILTIDCGTHGVMETNMNFEDVTGMLRAGREAADLYLREFDRTGGQWDAVSLIRRRSGPSGAQEVYQTSLDTLNIEYALRILKNALPTLESTTGESQETAEAALHTLESVLLKDGAENGKDGKDSDDND
jgi:predicted acylesterase/phospholipase RssA